MKNRGAIILIRLIKAVTMAIAIIFHLAIAASENVADWGNSITCYVNNNQMISSAIVIVCILFSRHSMYRQKRTLAIDIPASLFSGFTLVGNTFRYSNGFDYFDYSIGLITFFAIVFLGYRELFGQAITILQSFLKGKTRHAASNPLSVFVFDRKPMLKTMIIILLCWSPYYIINYPGTVTFDGYYQIDQFFGIHEMTAHHPVLSTVIMGLCMKIGQILMDDNFGIFLYTMLNGVVLALAFSSTLMLMKQMNIPMRFRWIALAFYSFYTEWPTFADCVIKDTMYTAFVVIYCVQCAYLMLFPNKMHKRRILLLLASAVLMCLYRKNGIYLIFITCTYSIWACKNHVKSRNIIVLSLFVSILSVLSTGIIEDNMGIRRGGINEALSIPFQQTARYVQKHEGELTQEEISVIDSVLSYELIRERYNPTVSDPVKGTFKGSDRIADYFELWFKQFLNDPLTYFAATIHNSYGYYCLEVPFMGIGDEYNIASNEWVNTGDFKIGFVSPLKNLLGNGLERFRYALEGYPVVSIFYNCGLYTWLLICSISKLIEKKRKEIIVILIPAIATLLICIASPVNAYHSYFLPVIATMPLVLSSVIFSISTDETYIAASEYLKRQKGSIL